MTEYVPHLVLRRLAAEAPEHVLVEFLDDRAYTAGELYERAKAVAFGLQRAGHAPGDRVALVIGNRIDFLAWWLGTAIAGLVSVPLNTAMRGSVLHHMLRLSGPVLVVAEREFLPDIAVVAADLEHAPQVLEVSQAPAGSTAGAVTTGAVTAGAVTTGALTTGAFLAGAGEPAPQEALPSTFASIMFTSGTTGPSKGVMWSHRMAMGKAESAMAVMGHTSSDVLFTCLPLFHANGLCTSFLPALIVRARLVVAPRFSASGFWPAIRKSGATVTNMLGSMGALLWKREPGDEERDHRLRKALVIPPPVGHIEEFEGRFGFESTQLYGSTDVGVPLGIPDGQRRPEACGRPLPGWECRLVDAWDAPVEDGRPGELVVRPRQPFATQLGYYGMPEATVEAWRNLWFHTGDLMRRDEDGWFYFLDRAKDSMRRSGENISSYEVEQVVVSHPSVRDAAAYGIPSELGEDEVMVSVVLREDAPAVAPEDVLAWCRGRLPYFAVPRYLQFLDELPRTQTAKVRKSDLRAAGLTAATYDAGPTSRSRVG
ncbi:AMP-binding protein [Streptomyces abyssomicinicus]|uniref:AMP-binding protein n=1 Tax=Streptomyces abyssomicinicus TaxID=574929 RepID=UPI001250A814|nr:AMP-binding protein [Streptomyces abyssomicinicus]